MSKAGLSRAAVAVASTALLASTCYRPRVPSHPEARALIYFCETRGRCEPKVWPGRFRAYRRELVIWEVENGCPAEQTVTLRDFQHLTEPGAGDPLESVTPERTVTTPANERREIRARVKESAVYGIYSYRVEVRGGAPADPEIEIEGRGEP
jgi:hypothetical protein